MGEGGDGAAKGSGHVKSGGVRHVDGNAGAFVKIYVEPRGFRKRVEDGFQSRNVVNPSSNNDEGVVGVLEDRTWEVVNKRVRKEAVAGGLENKMLKNIGNRVKKEGGEGVSLEIGRAHV